MAEQNPKPTTNLTSSAKEAAASVLSTAKEYGNVAATKIGEGVDMAKVAVLGEEKKEKTPAEKVGEAADGVVVTAKEYGNAAATGIGQGVDKAKVAVLGEEKKEKTPAEKVGEAAE